MSKKMIDERSLKILHELVESYIEEGQPVGSKAIAEKSVLQLSSATIRNIMADLESAGFLVSPHTSAGRVPTAQAYRLFVNHLLTAEQPDRLKLNDFSNELNSDLSQSGLIEQASNLLSRMTHLAGMVTIPKHDQLILKQVEFLPLSEKRILVVLILNNCDVQNRVIHTDREFTRCELEEAGNYLTQQYVGQDLLLARESLLDVMQHKRQDLDKMLKAVMKMAEENQAESTENDYVLAGESNLFEAVNASEYHQLRSLFEAFSQKRDILHLLDRSLSAQGLQIFIGRESGHGLFEDYSLIAKPYSVKGKMIGVLGVIGPTRMPYDRVISAVDVTSKLLSQALEEDS
jgi:heat-inducible transcriptional repressor